MGRRDYRAAIKALLDRQLTWDEKEFIDLSWKAGVMIAVVVKHIQESTFKLSPKIQEPNSR